MFARESTFYLILSYFDSFTAKAMLCSVSMCSCSLTSSFWMYVVNAITEHSNLIKVLALWMWGQGKGHCEKNSLNFLPLGSGNNMEDTRL